LAKVCWKWWRLCGKIALWLQKIYESFTQISLLLKLHFLREKIGGITFILSLIHWNIYFILTERLRLSIYFTVIKWKWFEISYSYKTLFLY
jgi:hypothetical protein